MSNSADIFIEFYQSSFRKSEERISAEEKSWNFIDNVIRDTPIETDFLLTYLETGRIEYFYQSLTDFKNLIEFSDNFCRYWHLLRAYSGALSKLKANYSVKSSKKIYAEYFEIWRQTFFAQGALV
jgi:hypothetical protein